MTPVMLVSFGLLVAGMTGTAYQMNRWLKQPLTDNDRYCAMVDQAIERELQARHQAALDEERRGLEADFHWAGVEAEWHAFIDGWPTLEDAR
jgi:hypothetical protein